MCKKTLSNIKIACLLLLLLPALASSAQSYFVDVTNGADTYDGTQWNHTTSTIGAFKTVDKALSVAVTTGGNIYVKQGTYLMAATGYTFSNKSLLLQGGFPAAATGVDISGYAAANTTTITYSGAPSPASISINNNGSGPYSVMLKGFAQSGITANNFFSAAAATEANTTFTFIDMKHGAGAQYHTYDLENLTATNSVSFANCSFSGVSQNTNNGTTIYIANSAVAPTLTTCTFNSNKAANGVIYLSKITADPIANIATDCVFTNNAAVSFGGVFYLDQNTGSFVLSGINTPFSGNTANYGGVISYANNAGYNGNTAITNCTFTSNIAATDGGIIQRNDAGTGALTITACNFTSNKATGQNSSVADVRSVNGLVTINNSTFTSNTSAQQAGVMLIASGTSGGLLVTGSTFSGNKASGINGGVFFLQGFGSLNFRNNVFSGNTCASQGGVITLQSSVSSTGFNIDGCTFNGNQSINAHSGAIYVSQFTGNINITKSGFCSNTSPQSGGAIMFSSVNGSIFIDSCSLNSNTSNDQGGAILYSNISGNFTLSNSTLSGNSAPNDGGATMSDAISGITTFSKDVFVGNAAASIYGGAIYSANSVIINACNFTKNHSANFGGALFIGGTLSISGATLFDANYVTGLYGGALYAASTTTIDRSTFRKNYINNNAASNAVLYSDVFLQVGNAAVTNSLMQQSALSAYGTGDHTGSSSTGNATTFAVTVAPVGCTSSLLILPVTIASFKGVAQGCKVLLSWQTATEINSSYFAVEASFNNTFKQIGKVASQNMTAGATYTFEDTLASASRYFRLKMVDLNGAFTYSDIIAVTGNGACSNAQVRVLPNPATDYINVTGITTGSKVVLLDLNGRKVREITVNSTSQTISLRNYAKGMYIVRVQLPNGTTNSTKVLKQ